MIELEKKVLLSADEYFILLNSMGRFSAFEQQVNHYFDTDNYDMDSQRITCRIREKTGEFKSTIKRHYDNGRSSESSQKAADEKDDTLFAKYMLHPQGSLTTTRNTLYEDADIKIVVDRNEYLGIVDYELEIEYHPHNSNNIDTIIMKMGEIISYSKKDLDLNEFCNRVQSADTKSQRFFNRKRYLKGEIQDEKSK